MKWWWKPICTHGPLRYTYRLCRTWKPGEREGGIESRKEIKLSWSQTINPSLPAWPLPGRGGATPEEKDNTRLLLVNIGEWCQREPCCRRDVIPRADYYSYRERRRADGTREDDLIIITSFTVWLNKFELFVTHDVLSDLIYYYLCGTKAVGSSWCTLRSILYSLCQIFPNGKSWLWKLHCAYYSHERKTNGARVTWTIVVFWVYPISFWRSNIFTHELVAELRRHAITWAKLFTVVSRRRKYLRKYGDGRLWLNRESFWCNRTERQKSSGDEESIWLSVNFIKSRQSD